MRAALVLAAALSAGCAAHDVGAGTTTTSPPSACERFLDVRRSIGKVSESEALQAINDLDANDIDKVRDAAKGDEEVRRPAAELADALRRDDFNVTVQRFADLAEICDRKMNR